MATFKLRDEILEMPSNRNVLTNNNSNTGYYQCDLDLDEDPMLELGSCVSHASSLRFTSSDYLQNDLVPLDFNYNRDCGSIYQRKMSNISLMYRIRKKRTLNVKNKFKSFNENSFDLITLLNISGNHESQDLYDVQPNYDINVIYTQYKSDQFINHRFTPYHTRLQDIIEHKIVFNQSIDYTILEQRIKYNSHFSSKEMHLYMQYIALNTSCDSVDRVRNLFRWAINTNHDRHFVDALIECLTKDSYSFSKYIHKNTCALTLQILESQVKDCYRIPDGYYSIKLCKRTHSNYIDNYMSAEEYLVSNQGYYLNSNQMYSQQPTYFYLKEINKYDYTYYISDHLNYIGINQKYKNVYIQNKINYEFQIEYLSDGGYIIIVNHEDKQNNKERNQFKVLALNLTTYQYEAVKLESLLNKQSSLYLYLWKFERQDSEEQYYQQDMYDYETKIAAQDNIKKIFDLTFDNLDDMTSIYEGFIILRRFYEFIDYDDEYFITKLKILFSNIKYYPQTKKYYSCSKMYAAGIYRGILNMLSTNEINSFVEYFYSRIETFINSRHESEIIDSIINNVECNKIPQLYDLIVNRFDIFWASNYGESVFNTAFSKMDENLLQKLNCIIWTKFGDLCKVQSKSFILQTFVKNSPFYLKCVVVNLMSSEQEMDEDIVYQFLNHEYANFILSAVCDITQQYEQFQYYNQVIINKIDYYYQMLVSRLKDKRKFKHAYHIWGKYVNSRKRK